MFEIKDLLDADGITIQCHDNPDADAIASAFAVYSCLVHLGKTSEIIYSGRFQVSKPNLLKMISELEVPITYVPQPATEPHDGFGCLVTVDCQYGAGNVTRFDAAKVVIIDHHFEEKKYEDSSFIKYINSDLGSCSTMVWDLLRRASFPFDEYPNVCTALYYGLFTDTGSLSEVYHPLDRDMRDEIPFNQPIVKALQNTNLSLQELEVAGAALTNYVIEPRLRCAVFKSEPCDPNILGFISDIAMQTVDIDVCVVYNLINDGAKLSIRCCAREVMAPDFAEFLTRGAGSGGGHGDKAGGFISKAKAGCDDLDEYINARVRLYFDSYDVIESQNHNLDISTMQVYKKLKIPQGYALSVELFPSGTPMTIRALEGDEHVVAGDDIFIMVGLLGEAYPITAEKFQRSYSPIESAQFMEKYTYSPTAKNRFTGESAAIVPHLKPCLPVGDVTVYARQLERDTKVFTAWNRDGYMAGRKGDYVVVRSDDINDVYLIRGDIFHMTYATASCP